MEKRLKMFFDKEGDVLDISIGDPRETISKDSRKQRQKSFR